MGHVERVDDEFGTAMVGHGVADGSRVARSGRRARESQPSAAGQG
ncbi:hypothetical protein QQY24_31065 [Streptomyces sp. TG1A-8]|nr:hypothetical protein [Streptomyces sp. TG1A-8]MDO0929595.1 hypothetical protein [Streptomyces sp. TG1A-8]